jgi:glycerol-3-phosphate O-acyltransferase
MPEVGDFARREVKGGRVGELSSVGNWVPLHSSYLEGNYGPLLRLLMRILFSRVQPVGDQLERIKELGKLGSVIYVLRSRSDLESLLCHYQCKRSGLPVPVLACDSNLTIFHSLGFCWKRIKTGLSLGKGIQAGRPIKELVSRGLSLILYLEDMEALERRFVRRGLDPFAEVLEAYEETGSRIFLVPQMVIWDRARERMGPLLDEMVLGSRANPSDLRVLINFLRFYRKDSHIFHAEPLELGEYIGANKAGRTQVDAVLLRKELLERLGRERRLVTGPVVRSRQELLERVLTDERVQQAIQRRSRKKGRSPESVRKEAYKLLKEIAADYDPVFLRFWDWVMSWAVRHLFDGLEVDQEGLKKVREAARRANLVIVPCHKSHMDYMIMGYVFYHNYLYPPLTAAGLNLAFWPMGFLFRKSGAFFIRRDFRGSVLYPVIFSRYLHTILSEGYPIEFFIEGGRSRSGKMVLPKPGFLAMLLEGHRAGACKEIAFVPVAISYERVMEERAYLKELEGAAKRKESLWEVLRSREVIRKKWGRIWVSFEDPIYLSEFLDRTLNKEGGTIRYTKQNVPDYLGYEIAHRINRAMTVVPTAFVASAALGCGLRGFCFGEILRIGSLMYWVLKRERARLASSMQEVTKIDRVIWDTLEFFHKEGICRRIGEGREDRDLEVETQFELEDRNRRQLDYYKNAILHHFLPYCFVAAAVLCTGKPLNSIEEILKEVEFLKKFFRQEFVFLPEEDLSQRVQDTLEGMVEHGLLWRSGMGYSAPAGRRPELLALARLVQGYFESYFVVGSSLKHLARRRLSQRVFLWRIRLNGARLYRSGRVRVPEALSEANYLNAIEFLVQEKILVRQIEGTVREGTYYRLSSERRPIHWRRLKRYMGVYKDM